MYEDARKMCRTKAVDKGHKAQAKNIGKKCHMGGHDMVRTVDRQGRSFDLVQKMLWLCATKNGTNNYELL